MALNSNAFVEGIDPTGTFGGYASVLLQLIRQALPSSTYGMVLYDSATPDVAGANAWRQRCVWLDMTDTANPIAKVYRTTGSPGWVSVNSLISNNTITTAMIQNAAVTLAKLSVLGGAANQLIRVNAGATAFEFVNFSSLFSVGVVPVNSINTTAVAPATFRALGSFGGSASTWFSADDIVGELSAGSIAALAIVPATGLSAASKFLTSRTADTGAVWRAFDPAADIADGAVSGLKLTNGTATLAKLAQSGATTGQVAAWNGSSWAPAAPVATTATVVSSTISVPTNTTLAGGTVINTTALGGKPSAIQVFGVCKVASSGYSIGDEISDIIPAFGSGVIESFAWPFFVEAAQITIYWPHYASYVTFINKTTGIRDAVTKATAITNWDLRVVATRIV
jgi:hypothetical protein